VQPPWFAQVQRGEHQAQHQPQPDHTTIQE
jgi:hypothetical protein